MYYNGTDLLNISFIYDIGLCQCADDNGDDGDDDDVGDDDEVDVGNDGLHVIPSAHPMAPKVGAR